MADNVTVHNGATGNGTSFDVVTDEITSPYTGGTKQAQGVKLLSGAANSNEVIEGTAANGLEVDVTRIAAGTNTIGKVRLVDSDGDEITVVSGKLQIGGTIASTPGSVIRTQVTPTVSTSPAYSAKDAVGALLTFANVVATSGGSVQVLQCQVVDKAQQMKDYDLVLFDRSITAPTDNSVFDPTDTELGYCCGIIPVGGWADFNDNSVFDAPVNEIADLNGTDLFGVLVSRSGTGPTFTATSDIVVTLTTKDLTG